jgi:hypothetical protein
VRSREIGQAPCWTTGRSVRLRRDRRAALDTKPSCSKIAAYSAWCAAYFDRIDKATEAMARPSPTDGVDRAAVASRLAGARPRAAANGALLDYLQRERGCSGYGVELSDANLLACVKRGVDVIQLNLEEGLAVFDDSSFDVVLQIDTLQHLHNAETMLVETARVGRVGVVAFPNFAHWPEPPERAARPHAGDQAVALPVVRHAEHPRGTYKDFECSQPRTGCRSWMRSGCRRGARCAPCRTCARARPSSSSSGPELASCTSGTQPPGLLR